VIVSHRGNVDLQPLLHGADFHCPTHHLPRRDMCKCKHQAIYPRHLSPQAERVRCWILGEEDDVAATRFNGCDGAVFNLDGDKSAENINWRGYDDSAYGCGFGSSEVTYASGYHELLSDFYVLGGGF